MLEKGFTVHFSCLGNSFYKRFLVTQDIGD